MTFHYFSSFFRAHLGTRLFFGDMAQAGCLTLKLHAVGCLFSPHHHRLSITASSTIDVSYRQHWQPAHLSLLLTPPITYSIQLQHCFNTPPTVWGNKKNALIFVPDMQFQM